MKHIVLIYPTSNLFSRYDDFFFLNLKNPFDEFTEPFFCHQVAKIGHKKKNPEPNQEVIYKLP